MKKGNTKLKQIKNKQHILANYPQDLSQKQQKYQSMNKFIKQYKIDPQETLKKISFHKIESKSEIIEIDHNAIYQFQCDKLSKNKKVDKEDPRIQKQQSRSTDHRAQDEEKHEKII